MKNFILILLLTFFQLQASSQVVVDTILNPFPITGVSKPATCMTIDDVSNNIWVGTKKLGLYKFNGSTWTNYTRTNSSLSSDTITCLFSESPNLYIGLKLGLAKFDGTNWIHWNKATNGIVSDTIRKIIAFNNEIWIGTYRGLSRFNGNTWINYTTTNSNLGCDTINDLQHTPGDTVWIATDNGLYGFFNNTIFNQDIGGNFASNDQAVHRLLLDNEKNLWIENFHFTDPQQGYNIRILQNGICKSLKSFFPYAMDCQSLIRLCGIYNNDVYGIGYGTGDREQTLIKINPGNWTDEKIHFSINNINYWPDITGNITNNINGSDISINQNGEIYLLSERVSNVLLKLFKVSFSNMQPDAVNNSIIDINHLQAMFGLRNTFFSEGKRAGAIKVTYVPEATPSYAGGIWMGSLDTNSIKVAATDRGYSDFSPGPIDTLNFTADSLTQVQFDRFWKINKSTIDYFNYQFSIGNVTNGQYVVPEEISSWPANPGLNQSANLAPYVDVNGDNHYDPFDGDYPLIYGDQELFSITNDIGGHNISNSQFPLGLEIHTSIYGFNCPDNLSIDSLLEYTLFVHYDIFNRSPDTLRQTYFGVNNLSRLGNSIDDFIGFNVDRNYYYSYNSDNNDESLEGYHQNPPVFNCVLLKGPLADPGDGVDNDRDMVTDESGECIDISSFMTIQNDFTNIGNPFTSFDYYSYMKSTWKDGTHLSYGGNGYLSTGGTNCNFMYPDSSDANWFNTNHVSQPYYWSENLPCDTCSANSPGIRGSVFSTGPFTMNPNDHQSIDIAFLFTWYKSLPNGSNTSSYLNNLMIDSLRSMWNTNNYPCIDLSSNISPHLNDQFNVYPNPATTFINIENLKSNQNYFWNIFNVDGHYIKSGKVENEKTKIDLKDIKNGIYFLHIQNKTEKFTYKLVVVE